MTKQFLFHIQDDVGSRSDFEDEYKNEDYEDDNEAEDKKPIISDLIKPASSHKYKKSSSSSSSSKKAHHKRGRPSKQQKDLHVDKKSITKRRRKSPDAKQAKEPKQPKVKKPKQKSKKKTECCPICGVLTNNIYTHSNVHVDRKEYIECEYCGQQFSNKFNLKLHFEIHLNVR